VATHTVVRPDRPYQGRRAGSPQDRPEVDALAAAKETDASTRPESCPQKRPSRVAVCSDIAGKLAQDPTVIRSSGDPGLDEAAVASLSPGRITIGRTTWSREARIRLRAAAIKFEIK